VSQISMPTRDVHAIMVPSGLSKARPSPKPNKIAARCDVPHGASGAAADDEFAIGTEATLTTFRELRRSVAG